MNITTKPKILQFQYNLLEQKTIINKIYNRCLIFLKENSTKKIQSITLKHYIKHNTI